MLACARSGSSTPWSSAVSAEKPAGSAPPISGQPRPDLRRGYHAMASGGSPRPARISPCEPQTKRARRLTRSSCGNAIRKIHFRNSHGSWPRLLRRRSPEKLSRPDRRARLVKTPKLHSSDVHQRHHRQAKGCPGTAPEAISPTSPGTASITRTFIPKTLLVHGDIAGLPGTLISFTARWLSPQPACFYEASRNSLDAGRPWRIAERLTSTSSTLPTASACFAKPRRGRAKKLTTTTSAHDHVGDRSSRKSGSGLRSRWVRAERSSSITWWQTENRSFLCSTKPALDLMKPGALVRPCSELSGDLGRGRK